MNPAWWVAAAFAGAPETSAPDADSQRELDEVAQQVDLSEDDPKPASSGFTVDAQTLERSEHDDISRVLQAGTGTYVRDEDGYGLRPNIGMRGADPNRSAKVNLMEDGVLFGPAPYAAPAAYYFPMVTRMRGVEVFKGPAGIRYGPNTIGGAVNLQTRPIPGNLEAGIDVAGGTYGYGKLHAYGGKSWERFGVLAEAVRVQTNGFKELDGGGDTGFAKNEFMLKGRVNSDPLASIYQQLDVKFGLATEVSNETYLGLTEQDFAANPYRRYAASALDRMDWWRTQAQLSYFVAGDIVEFQSDVYRHDISRAWRKFNRFASSLAPEPYAFFREPTAGSNAVYLSLLRGEADSLSPDENILIGTNRRDYVSQGVQNRLRVRPRARVDGVFEQEFEFGARLHYDRVARNQDEDQFAMLDGRPVKVADTNVQTTLNRAEALAAAFHVVDDILLLDRLTLSPGARVEVIRTGLTDRLSEERAQTATETVFLPGVGAHLQALPWLGVFAGVHAGFSPRAPGQADGGEAAQGERSVNYELGARLQQKGVRLELVGFANDYSNLVSNCTVSQGCNDVDVGEQFSGGEVWVAGSEARAIVNRKLGRRGWIDASASHTFTWSRFGSSFVSANPLLGTVSRGDALPYVPVHVASATLAGGMRRFGGHAELFYSGQMRDVPGQGAIASAERIDRFFVLDVGAHVFVTKRAQLYLNVYNAAAQRYAASRRPFGLRPGRRFSAIAGFKFDLN